MFVSNHDYRRALCLVDRCAQAGTTDAFMATVLTGMVELIGADEASYSELSTNSWTPTRFDAFPTPPSAVPVAARTYTTRSQDHPWVAQWLRRGRSAPVRLSDLYSRNDLRGLGYYADFFRPRGVEYSAFIVLCTTANSLIGMSVSRRSRDFTEAEQELLSMLQRPLGAAWTAAEHALPEALHLTPAELRVVRLLFAGWRNRRIADSLGVSEKAVEQHLTHAYRKLGVTSRTELVASVRGAALR